jgi:hypothetical protein
VVVNLCILEALIKISQHSRPHTSPQTLHVYARLHPHAEGPDNKLTRKSTASSTSRLSIQFFRTAMTGLRLAGVMMG